MNIEVSYNTADPITPSFFYSSGTSTSLPYHLHIRKMRETDVYRAMPAFAHMYYTNWNVEASTIKLPVQEIIETSVAEAFNLASTEEFEYGYQSQFSLQLDDLIQKYGAETINAIHEHFQLEYTRSNLIVEALHTLGRSVHKESEQERLTVLTSNLKSSLPEIRSAAAIGIAYMDDIRAIPALLSALQTETSKSSRVCLQRVLDQLQETIRHT